FTRMTRMGEAGHSLLLLDSCHPCKPVAKIALPRALPRGWPAAVYASGRVSLLLPRAFQQRALDRRHDQLDLVGLGLEARGEAQRVLAAVDHAQRLFAQPLLAGAGAVALEARVELAGEQQAGALDLGDQAVELALELLQRRQRLLAA